jgi:hypothetical protein
MEGLTVFAGYEKPWRHQMPILKAIARQSFVQLVSMVRPDEMKANQGHRQHHLGGTGPIGPPLTAKNIKKRPSDSRYPSRS